VTRVVTPFGIPAFLVTRYQDVREVLSDPVRFSNARTEFPFADQLHLSRDEIAQRRAGQPLALDPPDHTRLQLMLTPEFTVRRIRRLAPRIEQIVESHLDDLEREGQGRHDCVASPTSRRSALVERRPALRLPSPPRQWAVAADPIHAVAAWGLCPATKVNSSDTPKQSLTAI
jgi:cytochrome P450